jgi:hypothetical protein
MRGHRTAAQYWEAAALPSRYTRIATKTLRKTPDVLHSAPFLARSTALSSALSGAFGAASFRSPSYCRVIFAVASPCGEWIVAKAEEAPVLVMVTMTPLSP